MNSNDFGILTVHNFRCNRNWRDIDSMTKTNVHCTETPWQTSCQYKLYHSAIKGITETQKLLACFRFFHSEENPSPKSIYRRQSRLPINNYNDKRLILVKIDSNQLQRMQTNHVKWVVVVVVLVVLLFWVSLNWIRIENLDWSTNWTRSNFSN